MTAIVGPQQKIEIECESKFFGGSQVDDKLELARLHDGKICGPSILKRGQRDHIALSYGFIGKTSLNSAPLFPSEEAVSWPPWRSMMVRQIASPSPMPWGLVVTNASKMLSSRSG
jgi:hypothetical protein